MKSWRRLNLNSAEMPSPHLGRVGLWPRLGRWAITAAFLICWPGSALALDDFSSGDNQVRTSYDHSLSGSLNPSPRSFTEALKIFLTIPFREDGAQDREGRWVTFNQPDIYLGSPGFNCSGFTIAAARVLLGRNFSLSEASLDRRGDSGPGAALGQDWDFGLDLILNLAEAYPHRYLPEPDDPAEAPLIPLRPGRSLGWGVDIHGPQFEELLRQISPDNFCFFVFSRPDGRFPAGVSYYHVGVIVPEGSSRWLYHTTLGAKTNRIDLGSQEGLARLRRYFKPVANGERRVFMVEVTPPR